MFKILLLLLLLLKEFIGEELKAIIVIFVFLRELLMRLIRDRLGWLRIHELEMLLVDELMRVDRCRGMFCLHEFFVFD